MRFLSFLRVYNRNAPAALSSTEAFVVVCVCNACAGDDGLSSGSASGGAGP